MSPAADGHRSRTIVDDEAEAQREFLNQNKRADQLLGAMLDASAEMLHALSGEPLSTSQQFRVFILSQSWNAAMSAVQQLRRGYARSALLVPRFVFEGVAAATWAEGDPAAAERCVADYSERKSWPVGTWPERRVMFASLERWYDDAGLRVFQLFRDTENSLYSHALSDFAIDAVRESGPQLAVILGPRTTEWSTVAARHLVPIAAALLYAIARLQGEVTGSDTSEGARLHNEALEWSVKNPPEVHKKDPTSTRSIR